MALHQFMVREVQMELLLLKQKKGNRISICLEAFASI